MSTSTSLKMKKFFQEKVMDFKFKKAGEGHRLNEKKPPPSLPQSQEGEYMSIVKTIKLYMIKGAYTP